MVKGVTRRVLVVKAPDPKLFDQAIFLIREEALAEAEGAGGDQVLREATQAANRYLQAASPARLPLGRIPPAAYVAAGALVSSALWGLALLV